MSIVSHEAFIGDCLDGDRLNLGCPPNQRIRCRPGLDFETALCEQGGALLTNLNQLGLEAQIHWYGLLPKVIEWYSKHFTPIEQPAETNNDTSTVTLELLKRRYEGSIGALSHILPPPGAPDFPADTTEAQLSDSEDCIFWEFANGWRFYFCSTSDLTWYVGDEPGTVFCLLCETRQHSYTNILEDDELHPGWRPSRYDAGK